ncbi:hypothetical protein D7C38_24900, partial [Salmonella enterica]|nr:hypothetical protein [Salmonella enterica]
HASPEQDHDGQRGQTTAGRNAGRADPSPVGNGEHHNHSVLIWFSVRTPEPERLLSDTGIEAKNQNTVGDIPRTG